MEVKIADKAGFCFGVDRAVKIAYSLAEEEENLVTYGMLIHNRDVTEDLERCGVGMIHAMEELTPDTTVVIRAHGISKAEQEAILNCGAKMIDATCPYVKKIHHIVEKAHDAGRQIIICGDAAHPALSAVDDNADHTAIPTSSIHLSRFL